MPRCSTDTALKSDALLREVVRLYVQAQRATHACCAGASGKECEAATLLGRTGPLTVQEFARRMGLEKTWASRLAGRLEKKGVVKREPHPEDGRSWLVRLTPKGCRQNDALNGALDTHAVDLLSRVPPAERANVERALGLLRDALAAVTAGPDCG